MKRMYKRVMAVIAIIAVMFSLVACNSSDISNQGTTKSAAQIAKMCKNNSEYGKIIEQLPSYGVEFCEDVMVFADGMEFPYPDSWERRGVSTHIPTLLENSRMPEDIASTVEKSKQLLKEFIAEQSFFSNDEKSSINEMLDKLEIFYGAFESDNANFDTLACAVDDKAIYINSLVGEVDFALILHEFIHTVAYFIGNQMDNGDIFDSGLWAECMTDIITFAILNQTEIETFYGEFREPVLFFIEKIGIAKAVETYFRGNYEELEYYEELQALYIVMDAWYKFVQAGNYELADLCGMYAGITCKLIA